MKEEARHRKSKRSLSSQPRTKDTYGLRFVSTLGLFVLAWILLPAQEDQPVHRNLASTVELRYRLRDFLFSAEDMPVFSAIEKRQALLGKKFYFDKRFSHDGSIACASCHDPERSFSDGLPLPLIREQGVRRTPSIINSFAMQSFFWDGRASSLATQALGPIENIKEHAISRTHVVNVIRTHYQGAYEECFGPLAPALLQDLPAEAMPAQRAVILSPLMATYTLASFNKIWLQDTLLEESRTKKELLGATLALHSDPRNAVPTAWVQAWEKLSPAVQEGINETFANFGKAVAEFERGIVAVNAPFDRFAAAVLAGTHPTDAFTENFGAKEFHGLQLFLGPGACTHCHFGPSFSNQQFHNTGLPRLKSADFIDTGRAMGALLAREEGGSVNVQIDTESLEIVGAFKTPTLRNVANRAPYGHDGRFPDLASVLKHYNELPEIAELGHREESLKVLGFSESELHDLEAFLRSLSAPVIDATEIF